jgi:membrane-associated phospholipid phosphatase
MQRLLKENTTISLEESTSARVAHIVSLITNPLFVAMPTFLLIALHTAPDIAHAFLWWGVIVVGISLAPLVFIWNGVRRGHYTDQHLSLREQRIIPLLFGLICATAVFLILFLIHASLVLIATIITIFVGGVITLLITRYWKISMHLVGIAGSTTVLTVVYGPIFLLLTPLVILVGWARWRLGAHTLLQALAGVVLAVVVTLAIFFLFRLL